MFDEKGLTAFSPIEKFDITGNDWAGKQYQTYRHKLQTNL